MQPATVGPPSPANSPQTLILGSHLDSVPNGGWLDGCLGVLAAYAVLKRISEDYPVRPPITIRLVDWADEEGAALAAVSSVPQPSPALIPSPDRGRVDQRQAA